MILFPRLSSRFSFSFETANSNSSIRKAHLTCSQKHGEDYCFWFWARTLIRILSGMNILLWSLNRNDRIWCWPIMRSWTLPTKRFALKQRKRGQNGSGFFFRPHLMNCSFLGYDVIINIQNVDLKTIRRSRSCRSRWQWYLCDVRAYSHPSRKLINPIPSAFARIENHYFVNEVCSLCSSLFETSLMRP